MSPRISLRRAVFLLCCFFATATSRAVMAEHSLSLEGHNAFATVAPVATLQDGWTVFVTNTGDEVIELTNIGVQVTGTATIADFGPIHFLTETIHGPLTIGTSYLSPDKKATLSGASLLQIPPGESFPITIRFGTSATAVVGRNFSFSVEASLFAYTSETGGPLNITVSNPISSLITIVSGGDLISSDPQFCMGLYKVCPNGKTILFRNNSYQSRLQSILGPGLTWKISLYRNGVFLKVLAQGVPQFPSEYRYVSWKLPSDLQIGHGYQILYSLIEPNGNVATGLFSKSFGVATNSRAASCTH
jgi:hypothetical protein